MAVFLKIFSSVMSVLEPFVLGLAITELTSNLMDMAHGVAGAHLNISYIAIILVLYFVRGMGYGLSSYGSNFFITKAVQKTIHDLRRDLSEKINKIPVSYFDSQQFGNVLGRFTSDVETVSNALQQSFLRIIEAFTTITLVICMVLYLNWRLALVVIAIIPITYLSAKFILGKSQPYFKEQADALGDMNGFVQENLSGFNVIKLYGREEISSQEFREITQNLQEVGFKASFISGIMMPALSAISDMAYLIIAVLGALQVLSGQLTVGNMQAFVQYVWQVSQPVQTITQLASVLQSAKSSLDRIFEVLDEPEEVDQGKVTLVNYELVDGQMVVTDKKTNLWAWKHPRPNGDYELVELVGNVVFQDVDFSYDGKKQILHDVNLYADKGQKVALVGNNGSGKSTFLRILAGTLQAQEGEIIYPTPPYYVPQHFGQYDNQTVAQALRIDGKLEALRAITAGDASLSNFNTLADDWTIEERSLAALHAWGLEHILLSQPMRTLSGGEKTKVFLSGIEIHQPSILLLDEPTNHLDRRSREKLYDFITSCRITLLVVSHDRTLLNLLASIAELSVGGSPLRG